MKKRKMFALLVLLLAIGAMFFAGIQLLEAEQAYHEGNTAYEAFSNQVKGRAAALLTPQADAETSRPFDIDTEAPRLSWADGDIPQTPQAGAGASQAQRLEEEGSPPPGAKSPSEQARVSIPKQEINFQALKKINRDAAAWLYSPGTVIDYPVMKADDYSYYIDHLPDGTKNANGSLFIDYNCAPDFSDPLTVIYGHHMQSGRMFGSLKGYKDQKYYEKHPYLYLYTEHGNYRIDLIYGCVIGAGQWRSRAFMYAENADQLLAYAAHHTTFQSGVQYREGDRIVALSTCSYEFDDARFVVIGILRHEG